MLPLGRSCLEPCRCGVQVWSLPGDLEGVRSSPLWLPSGTDFCTPADPAELSGTSASQDHLTTAPLPTAVHSKGMLKGSGLGTSGL